jgi:hypothetical protein
VKKAPAISFQQRHSRKINFPNFPTTHQPNGKNFPPFFSHFKNLYVKAAMTSPTIYKKDILEKFIINCSFFRKMMMDFCCKMRFMNFLLGLRGRLI